MRYVSTHLRRCPRRSTVGSHEHCLKQSPSLLVGEALSAGAPSAGGSQGEHAALGSPQPCKAL